MKNLDLLFNWNSSGEGNKIKLEGNTLKVEIPSKKGLFNGKQIGIIIKTVNSIHKRYGNIKISIEFYLGKIEFIDKLTYIFLECICYYLIKHGHPVQVFMIVENNIRINGINSSPLLLLNKTKFNSICKFPDRFHFEIYGYHFRRVIRCEKEKTNYLGNLYEEIDRFLKPFSIDEKCRDEVALVVTELVGNACEHAETDCLVDIDVAPDFKKRCESSCTDTNYYYGINIAVIDFSEKLLGDSIKENILYTDKSVLSGRYLDVVEAYKYHKQHFHENYFEDDFCNITSFQSKISGRKEKFSTGGTGLPKLIKSLEDKSDTHRCYVISGNRCINFYQGILEYNENGWIGFNNEKNYTSDVPEENVVGECLINMPGTAYNFNFVMKGVKI